MPAIPSLAWRKQAVPGNSWSGLSVARMTMSRSAAVTPAAARASCDAASARSEVVTSGLHPVALPDAGPLDDPLVGGVHDGRQIVVGDHPRRQAGAHPGDTRPDHEALPVGDAGRVAAGARPRRAAEAPGYHRRARPGGSMSEVTFYREPDADPSALKGTCVAVLGYGNLGRSMALNLRDSGLDVVVGNIDDDYRRRAAADGFEALDIADAVAAAGLVYVLLPDEAMPECFAADMLPHLRPGDRPRLRLRVRPGLRPDHGARLRRRPDAGAAHARRGGAPLLPRRHRLLRVRVGGAGRLRRGHPPPPRPGRTPPGACAKGPCR